MYETGIQLSSYTPNSTECFVQDLFTLKTFNIKIIICLVLGTLKPDCYYIFSKIY